MSSPTVQTAAGQLEVGDGRTGKQYQIPIVDESIDAIHLRNIKTSEDDFGLMSFDPGFTNTAACRSAITYIDGDRGILQYRGYPIENIAGHLDFMTVSWLVLHGEVPSKAQRDEWESTLTSQCQLPQEVVDALERLPRGAYPMAMLAAGFAMLGAVYPDARKNKTEDERWVHARRLIAQVPAIAALAMRHFNGKPYPALDPSLGYVGSFLASAFGDTPNPVLRDALDLLFVLHADHEQNCGTHAVRGVASAESDPYLSLSAGVGALSGPLHGGANEAVLRMLREIGSVDRVPEYVENVKAGKYRLMGFGHRVYKNYDPRARVIKQAAERVFEVTGVNPLLKIALELERIALADDYFIKRKLYPNVDFYSGLIYEAMGFPVEMFPVLFAVARTTGWVAQWLEFELDADKKIARPRQIYTGPLNRTLPN
ncbi:MAG TPA: citrate/2-methylcitrate synthase [Chloroflexota bacterium]|nr:citrate/2-methylcitrate synthase [Chloroflexota bacterium]